MNKDNRGDHSHCKLCFPTFNLKNMPFNTVCDTVPHNVNLLLLANSVQSINRLFLHCWIPSWLLRIHGLHSSAFGKLYYKLFHWTHHDIYLLCTPQIYPNSSCLYCCQEYFTPSIPPEAFQILSSSLIFRLSIMCCKTNTHLIQSDFNSETTLMVLLVNYMIHRHIQFTDSHFQKPFELRKNNRTELSTARQEQLQILHQMDNF